MYINLSEDNKKELKGFKHRSKMRFAYLKKSLTLMFFLILLALPIFKSYGQEAFEGMEGLFTAPKHYIVHYVENAPIIDGDLKDPAWEAAAWSDKFIDIEGAQKPLPPVDTRVKMVWDKEYMYIAAYLEEPHIWANLKNHDDIVFYDNDFEVFLDPDNDTHQYFEIEVNAFNTIFDLFIPKPYRNGGSALISWDISRLQSAVQVKGTINDPSDTDEHWTIEMAVPFKAVSLGNRARIPEEGTVWRINFSRVQWDTQVEDDKYVKKKDKNGKTLSEHNWVWSPQGVVNMHFPERWGYLMFSRKSTQDLAENFPLPSTEALKPYLWLIYYKQKEYYHKHGHYANTLSEIGLNHYAELTINDQPYSLKVEATARQFMAMIQGHEKTSLCINQEGLIQNINPTR